MIGYYVHHQGRGHLHRATALALELTAVGEEVTGLSSLARPVDWPGEWVRLDRDDDAQPDVQPRSPTARGALHWAPLRSPGLRSRSAAISSWIAREDPSVLVVDVSVEVLLLARLHGVPTVGVVLPGVRDDRAHRLGFDVADELVACWPAGATGMLQGVPFELKQRVHALGALSRFPCVPVRRAAPGRDVVLLGGAGGSDLDADVVARAAASTPGWRWMSLGGGIGEWLEDPSEQVRAADVVVTHAGQNAVAEVAAARRPAVVIAQRRPHAEQETTARVLREAGLPAVVLDTWPTSGWSAVLERAAALDGGEWGRWCDGGAVGRFADVVRDVAGRR